MGRERALRGFGQFAEQYPPPQDPQPALVGGLLEQMLGDPAIRLARSTGRRVHYAGNLTVQTFVRSPAAANDPDVIELAPLTAAATARRALGRHRTGGL